MFDNKHYQCPEYWGVQRVGFILHRFDNAKCYLFRLCYQQEAG